MNMQIYPNTAKPNSKANSKQSSIKFSDPENNPEFGDQNIVKTQHPSTSKNNINFINNVYYINDGAFGVPKYHLSKSNKDSVGSFRN